MTKLELTEGFFRLFMFVTEMVAELKCIGIAQIDPSLVHGMIHQSWGRGCHSAFRHFQELEAEPKGASEKRTGGGWRQLQAAQNMKYQQERTHLALSANIHNV